MTYENSEMPEGVNVSGGRPFRDFVVQGGGALVLLVVLVWGIFQAGQLLGPLIPFEWEVQVSEIALKDFPVSTEGAEAESRQQVLQRLTDQLVPHMALPEGMTITIHYSNEPVVNAFATLGGNIVIFEGLIARLPSENALSMVIAHEIGHVKNRDVVRGMSGSSLVTFIVGLATGDSSLASQIVANVRLLTELQYSRAAEERADREGMTAINGHYGHVNGYHQTFDALVDWMQDAGGEVRQPPEFLRSHPDTKVRVVKLEAFADQNGWKKEGDLTPLRQANFPADTGSPYTAFDNPPTVAPPVKKSEKDESEGEEAPADGSAPTTNGNVLGGAPTEEPAPAPQEGAPSTPAPSANDLPSLAKTEQKEAPPSEPVEPFSGFAQ